MPYITRERRKDMNGYGVAPQTAGELNYAFTQLILAYLEEHNESYQTYNDIMGALTGCQLELYRRQIAPYEDKKIKQNGDVYG